MKFFLDNCISYVYAEALKILAKPQGYPIVHLRERFPTGADDLDWIPALGAEGDWVIVSGDLRISKSRAVRAAWKESGMTAFFFDSGWTEMNFWKQAEDIVRWWPRIVLKAREVPTGTGLVIPLKGKDFKPIY